MQHLLENRVYVMAEKCEFYSSSATFLGYILTRGQVNTDPVKIRVVMEWPTHTSQKMFQ